MQGAFVGVSELAIILVAAAVLRRDLLPRGTGSRPLLAAAGAGAIDVVANICYVAATRALAGCAAERRERRTAAAYPDRPTATACTRHADGGQQVRERIDVFRATRSAWGGGVNQLLVHELVDAVRA